MNKREEQNFCETCGATPTDNHKYDDQGLSEQEKEGLTCLIISADHTWEYQEPGMQSKVNSFPVCEDTNRIHTVTLEVGNLLVTIQEKK